MLGRRDRSKRSLFIAGDIKQSIPDGHILKRVDHFLDGYISQREPIADVVLYASNVYLPLPRPERF